jgi:PhnB protein
LPARRSRRHFFDIRTETLEPAAIQTTFAGLSLLLRVETPEKVEQFFAALSDGGQIQIPLLKNFFAERYGIVIDRFGISWKIMVASKMQN